MIRKQPSRPMGRTAFTLVELLVVIAIIGVLTGMALPALQGMRELARRSSCGQNLVQLSLAISSYNATLGHYPIGTQAKTGPVLSEAKGFHHNWAAAILPMLDAQNVYDAIDQNASVYAKQNEEVRQLRIPVFICPSATDIRYNATCYSGVTGSTETPIDTTNNGTFILNRMISDRDITDGLGYTLFVGEMLSAWEEDLGWMSGTRASLRDAGHQINAELKRVRGPQTGVKPITPKYVGGFASDHPNGAHLLLGSGEYMFRSNSMDQKVLEQMAERSDGQIPQSWNSGSGTLQQIVDQPVPSTPASQPAETPDAETPDAETGTADTKETTKPAANGDGGDKTEPENQTPADAPSVDGDTVLPNGATATPAT